MSESLVRLTVGRFTFDLDGFKPYSTPNSAVSHNFQSSAFVRNISRDNKSNELDCTRRVFRLGIFTKLSFAEFKRYSSGTERRRSGAGNPFVRRLLNSAKLSSNRQPAELSEAEFLAHVILKGVAFNTLIFPNELGKHSPIVRRGCHERTPWGTASPRRPLRCCGRFS